MLFALRLGTWGLAVFFAASPVIIGIASSPSHLSKLLDLSTYADVSRDLLFLAVAILALGIVDSIEAMISMIAAKSLRPAILGFAIALLLLIIPQIIMYSVWSTPGANLVGLPLAEIPTYVAGSALCALAARLTLVMA